GQLEAQQVLLAGSLAGVRLQAGQLVARIPQPPNERRQRTALSVKPGEAVQEEQVGAGPEQRLVIALAVDVHQRLAGGLEHRGWDRAAVAACGAAARGQ